MTRMIADTLGKEGFSDNPSRADLGHLFAAEGMTALPFNKRWRRLACAATAGRRRWLLLGR